MLLSNVPTPRVLSQGESLATLSARHGLDPAAVWSLAQNDDLRKVRPDPNVLSPHDILFVTAPKRAWMPVMVGGVNKFVGTPRALFGRLKCVDSQGKPLPDTSYLIDDVDPPITGTISGGILEFEVPPTLPRVRVHLPDLNLCIVAQVAHLDPVNDPDASGAEQRMTALGIAPPIPAVIDEEAREIVEGEYLDAALREFQQAQGVAVTGVVDDATRTALLKAHGA